MSEQPLLSAEWNINNESMAPDISPLVLILGLHSVKQRRKYWEETRGFRVVRVFVCGGSRGSYMMLMLRLSSHWALLLLMLGLGLRRLMLGVATDVRLLVSLGQPC